MDWTKPGQEGNLLDDIDNNSSIWKNSYFLQKWPKNGLTTCVTLDLPERKISKPKLLWVGSLIYITDWPPASPLR